MSKTNGDHRLGILSARPGPPTRPALSAGVHRPLDDDDTLLYVPASTPDGPVALVVLLHGATGAPERALALLRDEADRYGFLVLVPKSEDYTWDVIRGGFGPDVAALDAALADVFARFPVDPDRLAISGFSDGASYALSLGLINGDLFGHVYAFSPGFIAAGRRVGRPAVFISHGDDDRVLPVDRCGRRIAAALRSERYQVDYREFAGGHDLPPGMAEAAVESLR